MGQEKLKIRDIAALAGVSTAAVSAVLNNRPKVSAATRERILEIIRANNYVPQSAARALSGKRTYQIGFLVSCKVTLGLANNYFATILSGAHDICHSRNYNLVISTYDLSDIANFIMPTNIRQRNIDGLILAGITTPSVVKEIQSANIPFIMVGGSYPDDVLCVCADTEKTAEDSIEFLYDLGHRRLIFPISFALTEEITRRAIANLSARRPLNDLVVSFPLVSDSEFIAGEKLADLYFETPPHKRFTALVGDDQCSAGFLSRFIRRGGRCPDDVSILTIETPLSRYGIVPMTTVDYRLFEIGQRAANGLINLLEKKVTFDELNDNLHRFRNSAEIIIRDSTGPGPAAR